MTDFVAFGDSFAAGQAGSDVVPWPKLLEEGQGLAVEVSARPGATTLDIVESQVGEVAKMLHGTAIFSAGANDILRTPRPDFVAIDRALTSALRRLDRVAERTIVLTYPEFARYLPYRRRSKARVEDGLAELNRLLVRSAEAAGANCVDLRGNVVLARRSSFEMDGLHLSVNGNREVARVVWSALYGEGDYDEGGMIRRRGIKTGS